MRIDTELISNESLIHARAGPGAVHGCGPGEGAGVDDQDVSTDYV